MLIYIYIPGSQLGNAIQFLISGFIAEFWGWPAIFYVNGICGAVWAVFYAMLGSDSPQKSKMISAEERLYIQTSLGQIGEPKVKIHTIVLYTLAQFGKVKMFMIMYVLLLL